MLLLILSNLKANDFYRDNNFYVSFYPTFSKKPQLEGSLSNDNKFTFKARVNTHLTFQYLHNFKDKWGLLAGMDILGATNRRFRFNYEWDKSDFYSFFDLPENAQVNELYLKSYWWINLSDAFALNIGAVYRHSISSKIDININPGFKLYMVGKGSLNGFESLAAPANIQKTYLSINIESIDKGRESAILNYIPGGYISVGINHKVTRIGYFNYHFTACAPFRNYYQTDIIVYPNSAQQTTAKFKIPLATYGVGVNYIFQGRKNKKH
jgi:hypothetical protein